ncbi:hypothetical protein RFI_30295 [Reticulomyxa filosa]|uniref:Uncharacterized protein n=1 Tax=Reticulomyxa filosa TaxID=46433 RepID=X6M104_RETFI|nr:hypothetical protein RFI_30295 [Reticulomyxa filosa]|eukprot:ETO07097.1 hypothetical protein RFI_30295 [Reticulomyxa filosa]
MHRKVALELNNIEDIRNFLTNTALEMLLLLDSLFEEQTALDRLLLLKVCCKPCIVVVVVWYIHAVALHFPEDINDPMWNMLRLLSTDTFELLYDTMDETLLHVTTPDFRTCDNTLSPTELCLSEHFLLDSASTTEGNVSPVPIESTADEASATKQLLTPGVELPRNEQSIRAPFQWRTPDPKKRHKHANGAIQKNVSAPRARSALRQELTNNKENSFIKYDHHTWKHNLEQDFDVQDDTPPKEQTKLTYSHFYGFVLQTATASDGAICVECKEYRHKYDFTKSQWRNRPRDYRRCKHCTGECGTDSLVGPLFKSPSGKHK